MRINSSNHPIKAAVAQNISVKQGGPEISGTVKDQPDDFGGLLLGMAAFFIWGLFPLYFYFLKGVPPLVTVAFRIVFAMVFLIPLILYNGKLRLVFAIFRMPKMFFTLILSSLLNCGCIGMFVWLVVTDRTLYSSLSSYIGPLMTVFIGFLAFRERFSFQTWLAIIFAGIGVVIFSLGIGGLPWESLIYAATFSFYTMLRKVIPLDTVSCLSMETLFSAPWALLYIFYAGIYEEYSASWYGSCSTILLLIGSGIVTAVPFLLFGSSAKRIRLSTMGIIQYLSPTLQFLCSVTVFHEKMDIFRWGCFIMIWISLVWFLLDTRRSQKKTVSGN